MDKKKILLVSLGHLSCDINGGALPAILPFLRAAYDLSYQATGGLMFALPFLFLIPGAVLGALGLLLLVLSRLCGKGKKIFLSSSCTF